MSINDRLNEVTEGPIAPSRIEIHDTVYIRSEYFEDGNRIFYSPLDFALNGPDEGSMISRNDKHTGAVHKVKVLRKHYERLHPKPKTCPNCGFHGRMTIDHKHLENDVSFLGWKCHPCNLRNRRKYKIGPRW